MKYLYLFSLVCFAFQQWFHRYILVPTTSQLCLNNLVLVPIILIAIQILKKTTQLNQQTI